MYGRLSRTVAGQCERLSECSEYLSVKLGARLALRCSWMVTCGFLPCFRHRCSKFVITSHAAGP